MTPTGLIFDFDGVVVLSEPVHVRAWDDVARHFATTLPGSFGESGIGRSDGVLSDELAEIWRNCGSCNASGPDILAAKRRFYQGRAATETTLVPGIVEALRSLAARGPVALATSSSRADIRPSFERFALAGYFQAVLTIESIARPKPDPEIYIKAAASIGRNPRNCIVFEDSPQGAAAARAAGARVIGVTTSLTPDALQPILTHIPNFADLALIHGILENGFASAL